MSTAFDQESPRSDSVHVTADFERSFQTGPTSRFVLENPRGRIVVRGWDRAEIHVHAIKRRGRSNEQYEATQIESYQQGETVFLRTILDPSAPMIERGALSGVAAELVRAFGDLFRWNGKTAEVDYEVEVPRGCEVDLKGVSSSIHLTGLRAPASAYSVSGAVTAEQHVGMLRLQTVSGEVRARAIDGPLYVESVSGAARLDGRLASLAAKTVSGEIEVASPLAPSASYEVQTVSGNATFHVPEQSAASIAVRGVSGDVECEMPWVVTHDRRGPGSREWQGTLNGGGASLHFQTVSGNLRLRASHANGSTQSEAPADVAPVAGAAEPTTIREPVQAAPNAAVEGSTVASDPDGDQMKVLQALERGELSVDDALRELDRLRATPPDSGAVPSVVSGGAVNENK
jgi:hypothetical protein